MNRWMFMEYSGKVGQNALTFQGVECPVPDGTLSLYLVIFPDSLFRGPEFNPLSFRTGRFQTY